MNRFLLFALLGLSLAGNVWLLLAPREASPASAARRVASAEVDTTAASRSAGPRTVAAATAPGSSAPSAGETAAGARRGLVWRTPKTDDDYRQLAADLRAAGMPSRVIYTLVRDLYSAQVLAASPLAKAPYWQRRAVEQSSEMVALSRQVEARVEELAGPDGRLSARLDAVARARRYGDLSDAKIDAIAQLERDYSEMQSDSYRASGSGAFSGEEWAAKLRERNLLKAEQRADLAKILTPEELATYDQRNTDAARELANSLRSLDVNADEFTSLYAARQALDAIARDPSDIVSPDGMAKRREAQAAYDAEVRRVLDDARFYQYLAANNAAYRTVLGLGAKYPQVTAPVSYQVSQLQAEVEAARTKLLRTAPTPEAIQSAYANWNSRLDTLLGPAAAAEFRQTQAGRSFAAPPTRRAPAAATGTVPPRN